MLSSKTNALLTHTLASFWRKQSCLVVIWQAIRHYNDVIMGAIASQLTSLTIVYSTVYSGTDERKHQSSASLAFVRGSHRWPVNSPRKGPVTRKMFPFDDVIIETKTISNGYYVLIEYFADVFFICGDIVFFLLNIFSPWILANEVTSPCHLRRVLLL